MPKLIYNFETHHVLEVCSPNTGVWHRVTCDTFRSWDGQRRITKGNPNPWITQVFEPQVYEGPLYYFQTNKLCEFKNTGKIVYP